MRIACRTLNGVDGCLWVDYMTSLSLLIPSVVLLCGILGYGTHSFIVVHMSLEYHVDLVLVEQVRPDGVLISEMITSLVLFVTRSVERAVDGLMSVDEDPRSGGSSLVGHYQIVLDPLQDLIHSGLTGVLVIPVVEIDGYEVSIADTVAIEVVVGLVIEWHSVSEVQEGVVPVDLVVAGCHLHAKG